MNFARTVKLGGGFIMMNPLQLIGTPVHARVMPVGVSLLRSQQNQFCTASGEMAQQILFIAATSDNCVHQWNQIREVCRWMGVNLFMSPCMDTSSILSVSGSFN